jgi:RNA polymerase sigma factor (sigma-70 family)
MSQPDTDFALIQACRNGDEAAWERVLERYERLVYSIPLNYGLAADDAADIAQITFTLLLQALGTLRADTRLAAWLATVARRHTWRWLAQHRREAVGAAGDLAEDEMLGGIADATERAERVVWLDHALSLLDERCRALLLRLYFAPEQPSYAEVAERLHMPVGSVGPTRARCLERMKQLLAPEHSGESA